MSASVLGNVPDISKIVGRLQLKRDLEIPILDTDDTVNVKYARAGSGALSVDGFATLQKSIGKGEAMDIEDACEALEAFQVEWDLTAGGGPIPTTAEGIKKVPMILIWVILNAILSDFFQGVTEQQASPSGSRTNPGGGRSRRKKNSASSPSN